MAKILAVTRRAFSNFVTDDVLTLAAALSYYTLLSFAPIIVLALWFSAALGTHGEDILLGQFSALAGDDARKAAQVIIDSAQQRPTLGSAAGMFSLGLILVGATTVFAQLQASLNVIWDIQARQTNALWSWLQQRLLSVGVLAAVGFVLIVSLTVSALLGLLLGRSGPAWDVLNQVISTGIFSVLFAALFRYLPDARLDWRHAFGGGAVTAVLFAAGKWAIGFYLARGNVGGAYGAAGSLVVLMVWVYYSGTIFFFGAELVNAWLQESGMRMPLRAGAAHVTRVADEVSADRPTPG